MVSIFSTQITLGADFLENAPSDITGISSAGDVDRKVSLSVA